MRCSIKIIFLSLLLLPLCTVEVQAQNYIHSAGVRAGYSSGLAYKGFFRHRLSAIEANLLYNPHGFHAGLLYEYHLEPFRNKRALPYAGAGIFSGNWDEEFSFGIHAVLGFEYNLRDIPLSFSFDWRPMFNIYVDTEPGFIDFGLSIRYRL